MTCIHTQVKAVIAEHTFSDWLHSTGWALYSPPPPSTGLSALSYFLRLLNGSLSLSSHFLLLYELLSGALDLRVLPSDTSHHWGALLTWMLPPQDTSAAGLFMQTLRVLLRSPQARSRPPLTFSDLPWPSPTFSDLP